jgi:hypothetical protein
MISTRELRVDYKSGSLRWQPQNRRAVRIPQARQFDGFLNKVALAGESAVAIPPRALNFALYSPARILNS